MSRGPRLIVPELPHHIVQRGHNRTAVFRRRADYPWYVRSLRELSTMFDIRVYAFCLMTNHVHLILDPGFDAGAIPRMMKRLAGRHTRRINKREGRTGSLWEARYYSSPIDHDAYLLACCRYIELNPVRAGLAPTPADYEWSSYRYRASSGARGWLALDPAFLALGPTPELRARAYRDWVDQGVGDELDLIRTAIKRAQLTGGASFATRLAAETGRVFESRGPGRPPNQK
ncbi:MAG: transposase [Candidatus Binatia bacterium]